MKQSLKKNYIYNLIYQLMILILPLATAPYLSRVLGAENIGIYSFTVSISSYFMTFGTLGMTTYAQREIAYNQNNKEKCSKIFWEIFSLRLITMSMAILIFILIFVNGTQYQLYYKILTLEIIASMLDISWFFQGLEEFKKTIVKNGIVKIIYVILIFCVVKNKNDLAKYYIIYVFTALIGNMSLWIHLPKYIEKVKLKELKILNNLKPSFYLFIPNIAIQVYALLDKTMIGIIVPDKSELGFYEQSQKVIRLLLTIVTSLGTVMMPRIANKFAEGKKEDVMYYMKKSFNYVFILSIPMMFGIMAVSESFVPIFFGKGFDKVALIMSMCSPVLLIIGMSNVMGVQYLLPTKKQKEYTISVILGAVVNFGLNLFLIKLYGAIGASIATIAAELTVTVTQMIFLKNDFDFGEILKPILKYLFASICMFITCKILGANITNRYLSVVLQVLIGSIVYFTILLVLKDKFLYEIIGNIKEKIFKKKLS